MVRFNVTLVSWYALRVVSILALLLFIMGSFHGCGGAKAVPKEQVTFFVAPDKSINDERPVYIVIRKVNKKNFLTESYDNIVDMVYAEPPDESLLSWHILMPGQNEKILVTKPDKLSIGVYVLFTHPGEKWKMLLEKPLKSEYKIDIKKNVLEEYRKGLLW
jgi:hypothetical protein